MNDQKNEFREVNETVSTSESGSNGAIPPVLISGFSDEIAAGKSLDLQFSVAAALGLKYFSIRFVQVIDGAGASQIKNAVDLTPFELQQVRAKMAEYDLAISSLGSPLGKVKLLDVDDGTSNSYLPFDRYLEERVKPACETACQLGTRLIRGFSFYHPRGTDASGHLSQAIDQIGRMARTAGQFGLIFGLEVEANLVGHTGQLLAQIHEACREPALALIFDGGNLVTQGFDTGAVFEQYRLMKPGLGWIHIKDYLRETSTRIGEYVDEEGLQRFVGVGSGDSGYQQILEDIKTDVQLHRRIQQLELPGLFMDLEPHLKGGGQFGGFSGADGFGLACRELCHALDQAGLNYPLRQLDDVQT